MYNIGHEPPTVPPEEPRTYTADCGCEVVNGDDYELRNGEAGGVYPWEGRLICPEHAAELMYKLTLKERMAAHGSIFMTLEEIR